jgi:hypothetical protein
VPGGIGAVLNIFLPKMVVADNLNHQGPPVASIRVAPHPVPQSPIFKCDDSCVDLSCMHCIYLTGYSLHMNYCA